MRYLCGEIMAEPEKKEISEEAQDTINSLTSPIVGAFKGVGMDINKWAKEVYKLTKATKPKYQKMVKGDKVDLSPGVRVVADTDKEVLVKRMDADNETRHTALSTIGKATGWVTPEKIPVEIEDPLTLIIEQPTSSVKVSSDDRGEAKK